MREVSGIIKKCICQMINDFWRWILEIVQEVVKDLMFIGRVEYRIIVNTHFTDKPADMPATSGRKNKLAKVERTFDPINNFD